MVTKEECINIYQVLERNDLPYVDLGFLPNDIFDGEVPEDILYTNEINTLKKYFLKNGIEIGEINRDTNSKYLIQKSFDIVIPAIFIGYSALAENPFITTITLDIISSYVYDIIRRRKDNTTIKLDIVLEEKKKVKYTRIHYEGTAEGIEAIRKILKKK